jgi:ATP-dependent helicase/nuclease subunit B
LSADGVVELIPYGVDPLLALADRLLHRHADRLPDLSSCVILFPRASACPRFQRVLLDMAARRNLTSLFPPATAALEEWLLRYIPPGGRVLGDTAREALFFDALQQHPELRHRFGTWPLIDSLLRLFDELALEHCPLPDDPEQFRRLVAEGYGPGSERLAPLGDEAALVYSLWRAWRTQLDESAQLDRPMRLLDALARSVAELPPLTPLYVAGFVTPSRAELNWFLRLAGRHQLTFLIQGQPTPATSAHPDIPVTKCLRAFRFVPEPSLPGTLTQLLNRAYATHDANLLARAREQSQAAPNSPARTRLRLFEAADAEEEARSIALQLRRWRLAGKSNLGIVTNDRRLARRVRALLERAGIGIQDGAGWALSTTSAATALARWIECLEEDFHHEALLDLLRSPFVSLGLERADHDAAVDWLERRVILPGNIHHGLRAYRAAADHPGTREILDRIEEAARPLAGVSANRRRPGREYCRALSETLERLGLLPAYAHDDAGHEIIDTLDELETAFSAAQVDMHWTEFVRWLQRTLERRRFQPRLRGDGIELMSFAESRLYHFDALIIGGANAEHLPGSGSAPPLFNDGVRGRLGLPPAENTYNALFYDFRRLLEAGTEVVVTFRREHRGETLAPSPWVECLRAFHELAYNDRLDDPRLRELVHHPETMVTAHDALRPGPLFSAEAVLPPTRIPEKFFAAAHQSLIDCPFQFLARYGLGLPPPKEMREEMEGSDYGERVHRILEAFHAGVPALPGPWIKPLTSQTLPEARELMRAITDAVFAPDLNRSRLTQTWIYRWLGIADEYLDWQRHRAATWQVHQVEARMERNHEHNGTRVTVAGRIDRVDTDSSGRLSLIDYKTGALPKAHEVSSGEAVQLPAYALLPAQPVAEVRYLGLGRDGLSDRPRLDGDELETLVDRTRTRLLHLKTALDQSVPLPANGDDTACSRCHYMGLCRRQFWHTAKPGTVADVPPPP